MTRGFLLKPIRNLFFITLFVFLSVTAGLAQQEGFAESVQAKIYYRTFGSGIPILIINGGPGLNSDGFAGLATLLSANCQTIIYDQRGTGKSQLKIIDSSTMTMNLMVADIENLRKHLNIEKWIVLGHSFGGMLASYYATKFPAHIISMILSSSGGIDLELLTYFQRNISKRLTPAQRDSFNFWNNKLNNGDTTENTRIRRAGILANAYLYDKKYAPLIAARLTQINFDINGLLFQDMQQKKFNCKEGLSSFKKPVLIIQGKQDILEEKTASKAKAVLKNSTLIFLDKCGHYGWLDRKEKYLSAVLSFIASSKM